MIKERYVFFKLSACDWLTPTNRNDYLECGDGTFCNWSNDKSCCNDRGGRKRCPQNQPIMCSKKRCADRTDYCCGLNDAGCESVADGGPLPCGMCVLL